jgi:acyl carrier protein
MGDLMTRPDATAALVTGVSRGSAPRRKTTTQRKERTMPATIASEAVETTLAEALSQFGVEPAAISVESTFEELDVDSLDLTEISQIIDEEYGVELKGDDFKQIKTVGDAVDLVVSRAG